VMVRPTLWRTRIPTARSSKYFPGMNNFPD
jgi:hypothetical protein